MTDRTPLAQLTKAALDQLYDDLDRYEEPQGEMNENAIDLTRRAARAEAAIARVRGYVEHALAADGPTIGLSPGHILALLDTDPMRTTTQAAGHRYLSTGCLHGRHDYCKSMTGLNGEKRPGECKFCAAPCVCPCHGPAEEETTGQPEPATITDPEWLKQQYRTAIDDAYQDNYQEGYGLPYDEMVDAVIRVRDRHVAQLRQRLQLADHTLREILTGGQITGDRIARWRATLDEITEQPQPLRDEDGQIICTCGYGTPCGCRTSVHYDQQKES